LSPSTISTATTKTCPSEPAPELRHHLTRRARTAHCEKALRARRGGSGECGHERAWETTLDNYGIHKARLTRKTLAAFGGRVVLHFLPPYCPDSNRIERVWQDLHANVTRNHRRLTLSRLLDDARRFLDSYRWKRAVAKRAVARAA